MGAVGFEPYDLSVMSTLLLTTELRPLKGMGRAGIEPTTHEADDLQSP